MKRQPRRDSLGFFGLHYDLHANKNDDALGVDTTFEHIHAELSKVRPDFVQYDCKGHPGFAGYPTKAGIPAPGIVNDALRVWRDVTRKLNIPLLVHYSGVWDMQIAQKYVDWTRVEADGARSRDYLCNNGPYTEQYMIPQLLEITDWYDVDGFWVDGENWASYPCYCETCLKLFERETGITKVPRSKDEQDWDRWLLFHRQSFERHVRLYTDAIHKAKPNCLVCSNWMYSISQPDEVAVPIDFLSGDSTPSFGCDRAALECRFLDSHGMNWNLMAWGSYSNRLLDEGWTYPAWYFKGAEQLQQESAEVIMNGGGMVVYDAPQRTGHLISWRQDILAEVAGFCRERQPWCQGTESFPQVALLHNSVDYYAKNDPLFLGIGTEAVRALEGALHILLENHCHVDIVNEVTLRRNIGKYPVVVIPDPWNIPVELIAACEKYVMNGGSLIVSGGNGAAVFGKLLGVEVEGEPASAVYGVEVGKEVVSASGLWQIVSPVQATTIGYLYGGQELGKDRLEHPAATINRVGNGKAIGIYGPVFDFYSGNAYPRLRKFFHNVMAELESPELIEVDAPARLEISVRARENSLMVHLLNRGAGHPLSRENHAVEDIPPIGPIRLRVPIAEKPAKVYLAPETTGLAFEWADGYLETKVESVRIHSILVIELA